MRKTYVVYILTERDFVEEVSFFVTLDAKTSYGNLILESVNQEFTNKDDAETWIRRNGTDNYQYTIMEIFTKAK